MPLLDSPASAEHLIPAQELLPHRGKWLLLDGIEELTNRLVVARSRPIDRSELAGHFPAQPIVPGVLLIEMIAQAAGLLLSVGNSSRPASTNGVLLTVRRARFLRPLGADVTCTVTAERESTIAGGLCARGTVHHGEHRVAEAQVVVYLTRSTLDEIG